MKKATKKLLAVSELQICVYFWRSDINAYIGHRPDSCTKNYLGICIIMEIISSVP